MRGADDGRAGRARDVGEQRAERERVGAVEPGGRLVRDERERPRGERARQRGPLALTRRELADGPLGVLVQADRGESLGDRPAASPGSTPRSESVELRVLPRAEEGNEPGVCPTKAIARRRSSARPARSSVASDTPSTSTSPSSGTSSPASRCSSVVLPGARRPGDDGELARERTSRRAARTASPTRTASSARAPRSLVFLKHKLARNGLVERARADFVLQEH